MRRLPPLAVTATAAMLACPALSASPALAQGGYGDVRNGVRAQLVQIVDSQGPWTRPLVAYTLLVPANWQTQGGIEWGIDDGCNGAGWQLNWVASTGDGEYGFALLPNVSWAYSPSGSPTLSQCPAPPVTSAAEYLLWRASFIGQNVQVIGYEERPDLLREVGLEPGREANPPPPGVATTLYFDAGELHFTYEQEGARYEAVMSTAVIMAVGQVAEFQIVSGTTLGIFFSAAPDGALDVALSHLMQKSIAVGVDWSNGIRERADAMHRQQMAASAAAHRATMQMMYETNDMIMQGYRARTDMSDTGHRETMESIRGVETWDDPVSGQPVQFDDYYRHTWRLEDGTYLLSNDADLEPFRDLGIDGQALQVTR